MRVLFTGEKVRVVGEEGEFLILSIDNSRYVADLMHLAGTRKIELGVALRALRPIQERPGARSESFDPPSPSKR